jgi:hypothetical protein
MRNSGTASKTVVMSATRNLRKRCPEKLCPRSETSSGCRPKYGIYSAHVWPLFGQRNAYTKTPSETAEPGGLAGAKDLMVRSMRLRNHIGVELTDPNLRLSGF